MSDKSPKAKQKAQDQKSTAKTQSKNDQNKRQAAFASTAGKDKEKKK